MRNTLIKLLKGAGWTFLVLMVAAFSYIFYFIFIDKRGTPQYCSNCQSTLNQLGKAFKSYLADWDDTMPSSALRGSKAWNEQEFIKFATLQGGDGAKPTYVSVLSQYVEKDIAWCPLDRSKSDSPNAVLSYWYKAANDKAWFDSAKKDSDYKHPDSQILLYEHTGWHGNDKKTELADGIGINCLFMDGHAKYCRLADAGRTPRKAHPTAPGEPAWYNFDFAKNKSLGRGRFCDPKTQVDSIGILQ